MRFYEPVRVLRFKNLSGACLLSAGSGLAIETNAARINMFLHFLAIFTAKKCAFENRFTPGQYLPC
ncbi:hypothetical protein FACS189499_00700 [Clostridia bacterium]|nr:hypothetical protein FACS189499_00700 [Clostridia bacterium]